MDAMMGFPTTRSSSMLLDRANISLELRDYRHQLWHGPHIYLGGNNLRHPPLFKLNQFQQPDGETGGHPGDLCVGMYRVHLLPKQVG